MNLRKKIISGIATTAVLLGGGMYGDAKIDPYTQTSKEFSIAAESVIPEAGENKVTLNKDKPEVKLSKFNGEVELGIEYEGVKAKGNRKFLTDKVEWKDSKQEVHAYPLEAKAGMEDGGFEIEIVLNEAPASNEFPFKISGAENLDFFYQPALTAQEITEGAERPDNVVGSYAVYHKTKANHVIGQTNYATGKAYHIYRPLAKDANQVETWAELAYSEGVLTVTVPQNFLNTAAYPVVVDPTFGYTSAGASNTGATDYFVGSLFTAPADMGTFQKMTGYKPGTSESNWKGVITNSSQVIIANGVGNGISPTTDNGWNDLTYTSAPTLSASTGYYLGLVHGGINAPLSMDTTGGTSLVDSTNNYTTPTNPSDGTDGTRIYSIYATYTASGGAATNGSVKLNGGTLQLNGGSTIIK